tara:strand:+ start:205 stop:366 length:162 start_codon:yes stop_codon:yes gene_type:complete
MIFTYKIYLDDNFLGYEYAISEYSARQKAFNVHGSASRFTGVGMDNIRAVRIN